MMTKIYVLNWGCSSFLEIPWIKAESCRESKELLGNAEAEIFKAILTKARRDIIQYLREAGGDLII